MSTISAAAQPDLANEVLSRAIAGQPQQDADALPPAAPALPNTTVALPAGLLHLDGSIDTVGEVRELDGNDEEALARAAGSIPKTLEVILTRGVVSLGGNPVEKGDLDRLLAGDREALILGVRRVTFGNDLDPVRVKCPHCADEHDVTLTLDDIPVRELEDRVGDRQFFLTLPSGKRARVKLPDGEAAKAVANSVDTNYGVLNSLLLSKTVQEINDMPIFSAEQVKSLGMRDRDAIITALAERNPGPRLGEVSRSCTACSQDIPLPLSLTDLFRL